MSTKDSIDKFINNFSEQELNYGFDENEWEKTIDSVDYSEDNFSISEHCETITDKQDIVKLSIVDKISNFLVSHLCIGINQSINILVSPSLKQHVRYKYECERTLRYISVPQQGTLTIEIPDLLPLLLSNNAIWMRITRITSNDRKDKLTFYHPYPIWIKNKNAKIHHGSIFIQITEKDILNRVVKIDNLTMIRLKQKDLATIKTLPIYSPTQLDFTHFHSISDQTAKQIRDEYNLRYSVLTFQLISVDENNTAHPINCCCQTEPIREMEANEQ